MSVRVNLLPSEIQERGRADRARVIAGILGVVFVLVLAGLTLLQRDAIGDAEQQLAQIQATNDELQADIAALQPFADLEARADQGVELIGLALGHEGSFATILQDLSAVLPPSTQIDQLAIQLGDEAAAPSPGGARLVYGTLTASGQVLEGLAPGVERLIIDLDRVAAFDNVFVTTSAVDVDDVTSFTLTVELGPEVLTERYGLDAVEVAP